MYDPQRDRVLALVLQHGHTQFAKFGVPPTETTPFMRLHLRSIRGDAVQKLHDAFELGAGLLDLLIPDNYPFLARFRIEQAIALALDRVLADGNFALDTLGAGDITFGLVDDVRADVERAYSQSVILALQFLNENTADAA